MELSEKLQSSIRATLIPKDKATPIEPSARVTLTVESDESWVEG